MATLTLEYDARNSTGLLSSGLFRVQSKEEKERAEIQENMRIVSKMIDDIRVNSSSNYQNIDSFLFSLK